MSLKKIIGCIYKKNHPPFKQYIKKHLKTNMDVEQLFRIYPQLDRLMAETLLALSKQGKLQKYLDEEKMAEQPSYLRVGAISVEDANKK